MDVNYKIQSHKSFEDTIEDLKDSLKEHGFGVLWEFDLKGKLVEKGLDYDRKYTILEVCNPKQALEVLNINHEAGFFLPCKIIVYENHGDIYVGMPKPTFLINLLADSSLEQAAKTVESSLKTAILKSCEVFNDKDLSHQSS